MVLATERIPHDLPLTRSAGRPNFTERSVHYPCPGANTHETLQQNLYWGWCFGDQDFANSGTQPALVNQSVNYGMSEPLENDWICGTSTPGCTDAALTAPADTLVIADMALALSSAGAPSTNPTDPAHHYIISRIAYANAPSDCWTAAGASPTCGAAQFDEGDNRPDQSPNAATFDQQSRHTGGQIIGYADGHAKWLRDTQTTWDLFIGYTGPY